MFTLYKMIFYLKFLSHTVKFGQNRNKVDNVKIIIPRRKNRKFREERAYPRYRLLLLQKLEVNGDSTKSIYMKTFR